MYYSTSLPISLCLNVQQYFVREEGGRYWADCALCQSSRKMQRKEKQRERKRERGREKERSSALKREGARREREPPGDQDIERIVLLTGIHCI